MSRRQRRNNSGFGRLESLESRAMLCSDPFFPGGVAGDGSPDFYYSPATGAMTMRSDGVAADTILITGPEPNSIEFNPGIGWDYRYFNGKMQWINFALLNGATGNILLAYYDTGLDPATAFPCVEALVSTMVNDETQRAVHYTNVVADSQQGPTWQNPKSPLDVNNDGSISPLDALLVINELSARVSSDPTTGRMNPSATAPPYLDTNDDGFVTPIDALLVINALPSTQRAPLSLVVTNASFQHDDEKILREDAHEIVLRSIMIDEVYEYHGAKTNS